MALNVDTLFSAMQAAGAGLAGEIWSKVQMFAIPELKKIALQIKAIETNLDDYTPAGARALLDMQINASKAVIVAMTTLTLLAVQKAIDEILQAVKGLVNGALGFALI